MGAGIFSGFMRTAKTVAATQAMKQLMKAKARSLSKAARGARVSSSRALLGPGVKYSPTMRARARVARIRYTDAWKHGKRPSVRGVKKKGKKLWGKAKKNKGAIALATLPLAAQAIYDSTRGGSTADIKKMMEEAGISAAYKTVARREPTPAEMATMKGLVTRATKGVRGAYKYRPGTRLATGQRVSAVKHKRKTERPFGTGRGRKAKRRPKKKKRGGRKKGRSTKRRGRKTKKMNVKAARRKYNAIRDVFSI